jgi:hypothetical protein
MAVELDRAGCCPPCGPVCPIVRDGAEQLFGCSGLRAFMRGSPVATRWRAARSSAMSVRSRSSVVMSVSWRCQRAASRRATRSCSARLTRSLVLTCRRLSFRRCGRVGVAPGRLRRLSLAWRGCGRASVARITAERSAGRCRRALPRSESRWVSGPTRRRSSTRVSS